MYHKIRIAVISLVVAAMIVLSSTGTLSYFTDTDAKTNGFTIGNASTTLAIYNDESGDSEHIFDASDYTLTDELTVPFYLQATNGGNIPVYQRFRVVIPIALASVITLDLPTMNDDCVVETAPEHVCENANYVVTYNPSVEVGDTPTYAEYYIVRNDALVAGATTREWPTKGIKIGDISGVDDSLFTCADNSNNHCVLGVNAYSDAIQTTGFVNATVAFVNMVETY